MANRRYRRWLRLAFTRTRPGDVDDEFQFHLAMRARELETQGYTPEDARQEALAQFGDLDDARAFCRAEDDKRMREQGRTLWLENVRQDVRIAVRTLRRQPTFAVSTVLTLAVAIALAASSYGVAHAYLVRPLPYPEADRLVRIIGAPVRGQPFPNAPNLSGVDWTVADTVFAETVRTVLDGFTLMDGDRPEVAYGAWVSPAHFSAFGIRPAIGRVFTSDEHRQGAPVAIISDELWSRRYGRDPSVIGRSIRLRSLDGAREGELVTVTGVTPPATWHIHRFTDVLRPLVSPRMPVIARLKPGMSIDEAAERFNTAVRAQLGDVDPAWRMSLYPLQDQYTYRVKPTLIPLVGGAAFLLLIAAASVAGVQAARAAARRAEMHVRVALGASRTRLVAQLLTETVLIAAIAGVLGSLLANTTLGALGTLVGQHLPTGDQRGAGVPGGAESLTLGPGMLAMVVAVGALLGIAFGLVPAFAAVRGIGQGRSSASGLGSQKGVTRSGASPAMRRGLIVAQVACTMMLLVGAGLMTRTVLAIGGEPLGFSTHDVVKGDLMLGLDPEAPGRGVDVSQLLSGVSTAPGVRATALVFPHPFWEYGNPTPRVITEGAAQGDRVPEAKQYAVSPGYFEVLQIALVSGRDFGALDDGKATPVAIVSDDLARQLWPGQQAIGRRVRLDPDSVWRTVIGIVHDTREPIEGVQRPDVYVPYAQAPHEVMSLVARMTDDPATAAPILQRAVGQANQALGNIETMSDVVTQDGRRQRALASVLAVFALLGLGLAMLAVYASLAYLVAQRRREIAIRVAVGATSSAIRSLVLREGVILVAVGVVVGGALSLLLTRLLSTQLYGVTPTDPGTFGGIALLLGLSALLASLAPLRHAVRVHPAETLRSE